MKKILIVLLTIFLASCKKEENHIQCKEIEGIVGSRGVYSLHFTDGTSYFNFLDTTMYAVGDEFCVVESEFINAKSINPKY